MTAQDRRYYIEEFSNTYQNARLGERMRANKHARIKQHDLIFVQETANVTFA